MRFASKHKMKKSHNKYKHKVNSNSDMKNKNRANRDLQSIWKYYNNNNI